MQFFDGKEHTTYTRNGLAAVHEKSAPVAIWLRSLFAPGNVPPNKGSSPPEQSSSIEWKILFIRSFVFGTRRGVKAARERGERLPRRGFDE